jgi:hypothetical protein
MAAPAGQSRIESDLFVAGTLTARSFSPPALSVGNAAVASAAAGAGISDLKLEHQHHFAYAQANTTAVTITIPVKAVYGTVGALISLKAGTIVACIGAATITVDLKKNGTTMLTAPITLNSSNTARVMAAATISVTAMAAGDFLELVITATAGGGTIGTGLLVQGVVTENAL